MSSLIEFFNAIPWKQVSNDDDGLSSRSWVSQVDDLAQERKRVAVREESGVRGIAQKAD